MFDYTTTADTSSISIALLMGGKSGEREISLASGEGVKAALEEEGFQVTPLDPASKDDLKRLVNEEFDVAFICLHGKGGEDGVIQGFLETLEIPYTGSGVYSSALAMDKEKAKVFYQIADIPTPLAFPIEKEEWISWKNHTDSEDSSTSAVQRLLKEVKPTPEDKWVVKPIADGSSLGVYIVDNEEELVEAFDSVFDITEKALVERYIKGIELTVAVYDEGEPVALPVIQIVPKNDSYDFTSKYAPGGSQHICPAPLDGDMTAILQTYAVKAHRALDCKGMSRSDFILDEQGNPWILETNTIPGMTKTSLVPDAARACGIEFPELCKRMVYAALKG